MKQREKKTKNNISSECEKSEQKIVDLSIQNKLKVARM